MIVFAVMLLLMATEPSSAADWKQEPEANVAPRSFGCSREGKGMSYIVVSKTPDQNFVDYWEKYTGDVEPLKLRVKGQTKLATMGDERFLITSEENTANSLRLEFWPDKVDGLKGHYVVKADGKESRGECMLIAMLPRYENFK